MTSDARLGDNMLDLGLRLKLFRVAAGLKQRDVGSSLGVTVNYVSMIERGKREPTLPYLRKFAKLVHLPLAVLFWEPTASPKKAAETKDIESRIAALVAQYAAHLGIKL